MGAPKVLFVSLTDDVGTDRLVSALGKAGAVCAVLGPVDSYASLVRCVSTRFALPRRSFGAAFRLAAALRDAVRTWQPTQLIALDDLSATLLRTLATSPRSPADVRALVQASFGAPAGYEAACQRVALMRMAEACGVRVPPFAAGFDAAGRIADDLGFPLVVKRDQSSGSGGVVRVASHRELTRALRFAQLKTAAKSTLARLAHVGRPATPALVQRMIDGRLAMFTVVCRDGRVIDGMGFTALVSHPVKRSSTILQPFASAEMAEAARRLVTALGCSGFVSFDFIVDLEGRAFLIEMNPRPIGSVHLGRLFGHDLVQAFMTDAVGSLRASAVPLTTAIALFPKELERDPAGSRLRGDPTLLHDVPLDEPDVLAAYVRHLTSEHPTHAWRFEAYLSGSPPKRRTTETSLAA